MRIKKNGFSLIEIIVVFAIIGIIVTLELIVLQRRTNEYSAPYFNAYSAIKKTSYNILADMYCPDANSPDPECKIGPRPFPTNSYDLCRRFAEFINVPGNKTNCGTGKTDTSLDINDEADNIKDEKNIRFTASNANRFYFTSMKTHTLSSGEKVNYFIVYVDLNGNKTPNRVGKTPKDTIYPDIVPFVITTRGETIPIGYPVYTNMYLTAKIKFPPVMTGEILSNRYSKSMSYNSARYGAWGGQESIDITQSIDFNNDIPDTNLGKEFYLGEIPELTPEDFMKEEGCKAGEYTCRVLVDKFVGKRF